MCATGTLKAIETQYNGYRFRSRLEARWAVFFDALNIPYQYEVEGFDLDGTWYLPDFYLPVQKYWIEIKPCTTGQPEKEEWPSHPVFTWLSQLNQSIDIGDIMTLPIDFYLLMGEPWVDPQRVRTYHSYTTPGTILHAIHDYGAFSYVCFVLGDYGYSWCECPTCGYVGLEFDGRANRLPCGCRHHDHHGYNNGTPRILAAYRAARQARFER